MVAALVANTPAAADYCSTGGLELVAQVNFRWHPEAVALNAHKQLPAQGPCKH